MGFHDESSDVETEPRSASGRLAGRRSIVPTEDQLTVFGRNADASIDHVELYGTSVAREPEVHRRTVRGILERVRQQVDDDSLEPRAVCEDRKRGRALERDRNASRGSVIHARHDVGYEVGQVAGK